MKNITYEINQFYRILGTECPKYKNIRVTENDLKDENILSEVLYDIEDNVYVYEGAEELYHDIRYYVNKKNTAYKIIKFIGVTLMIFGFIFMLGTAGATDLNTISFQQTIIQSIISLSAVILGLAIINKMEE